MKAPFDTGDFSQSWRAEILRTPPLIAPARTFTYPRNVAGEEDALARGALQILVNPSHGGKYLIACALGFRDPSMPSGVHACPNADHLCAVAGGYAYLSDTRAPASCTLLELKPVVELYPLPKHGLLLLIGFHALAAWNHAGLAWQTARLSWEGIRLLDIAGSHLRGVGWNMLTDKEIPFTIDLQSGSHTGGAYTPVARS